MIRILILAGLLLFQSDDPHPELPACNRHFDNPHKCFCARAPTKCEGKMIPMPAEPDSKCHHYCDKGRCECMGDGCAS